MQEVSHNEQDDLKKFIGELKILDILYDATRVVDPVNKIVYYFKDNALVESDLRCYDVWKNGKSCENCISMRAYNTSKSYVKLEFSPKSVYIVSALPYEFNGRKVVFELMKDVTETMMIDDVNNQTNYITLSMIQRLNTVTIRDELTGIYNRRYINERLPANITESKAFGVPISVIMADIDNLKAVNDNLGHLAGDKALMGFADIIKSCIGENEGWVARYGGDEFLISLPGADDEKARNTAEDIRAKVFGLPFLEGAKECGVSGSFGVFTLLPSEIFELEEVIAFADKKLYEAKKMGKNIVVD